MDWSSPVKVVPVAAVLKVDLFFYPRKTLFVFVRPLKWNMRSLLLLFAAGFQPKTAGKTFRLRKNRIMTAFFGQWKQQVKKTAGVLYTITGLFNAGLFPFGHQCYALLKAGNRRPLIAREWGRETFIALIQ